MIDTAPVISALRDFDVFERLDSSLKLDWFGEDEQAVVLAIRQYHREHQGRVIPWKDLKLILRGRPGYGEISDLRRKTNGLSPIGLQKAVFGFMMHRSMRTIVESIASEVQKGKNVPIEKYIAELEQVQKLSSNHKDQTDFFDTDMRTLVKDVKEIPIVSLPSAELTTALDGGLAAGQLITVLAKTDGGKTSFLINCGRHAVEQGKTVLHTTHETTRYEVTQRYASSLCRHSWKWISKHPSTTEKKKRLVASKGGHLSIADFSAASASVSDIRVSADRMQRRYGKVDLIIVDYGDLVRSSRRYESRRDEHRETWAELRRLGKRYRCPVITATQSNRAGAAADQVELVHIGEAWGKATDSDAVLVIQVEKNSNKGHVIIEKTKRRGKYPRVPILFDRERCYIR